MSKAVEPVSVVPQTRGVSHPARCIMFYEFDRGFSADWLDWVETVFSAFDVKPHTVSASIGDKELSGLYPRVRKRLAALLNTKMGMESPDVRIDSRETQPAESFFPSEIRVAWSTTVGGQKNGVIAVRASLIDSVGELVERLEKSLFEMIGTAYAHALDFPAEFGPDFYLGSVGAVPTGYTTQENTAYEERLVQWRDRIWHGGVRARQGYLREVYPINFLLEPHLGRPYQNCPFRDYMERNGKITFSKFCEGLYRWDVESERLSLVREDLERSGLVLSSPPT